MTVYAPAFAMAAVLRPSVKIAISLIIIVSAGLAATIIAFLAGGTKGMLVAIGAVIGILTSFGLTRFLAGQIWNVSATDLFTFCAVLMGILAVGVAACFIPARRAAALDPLVALRYE